jgi:hypothetical protein
MTNAVCASPIDGAIARRDLAGDLTLLLAWPLLLLLIDFDWAFTPPGSIDPWVYFGTFVNLSYNLTTRRVTTSATSWILPTISARPVATRRRDCVFAPGGVLRGHSSGDFCVRTAL